MAVRVFHVAHTYTDQQPSEHPRLSAALRVLLLQIGLTLSLCAPSLATAGDKLASVRVEYQERPIGLGVAVPRFSWVLESARRGQRQTAYQILVASSPEVLARGQGDVWNSEKVDSLQNAHIEYRGAALQSNRRYHFVVRVWDAQGKPVTSAPCTFHMGLLQPQDWQAQWIGLAAPAPDERTDLAGSSWIWLQTSFAGVRRLGFVKDFDLPSNATVVRAELLVVGNDLGKPYHSEARHHLWINGQSLGSWSAPISDPRRIDVLPALRAGSNRIAVAAPYEKDTGLLGTIVIALSNGEVMLVRSDASWRARTFTERVLPDGWHKDDATQAPWQVPNMVAPFGAWKASADPAFNKLDKVVPPIVLRRTFAITKPVRQATIYATAAGIYELYCNGNKVGNDVLAPGWTDYGKHIRYQSYDVTTQLKQGDNVVGAIVADGWYSGRTGLGQNLWGFGKALLAQLMITYADGSTEVVATDPSWSATTGPWRAADILDGELYDARRELGSWSSGPGLVAATWRPASVVDVSVGKLQAQVEPPVRPVASMPVRAILPSPGGGQIFDFGQNLVGWAKVRFRAKRGSTITFRWAEVLGKDGKLFTENLRTALATDRYIARGGGEEQYEPHFTYHGFRYLHVEGLSTPLARGDVTAVVVSSDLPATGRFATSNKDLNQLQSNIVWGQRGNFVSIPTDCPQRDERLGWSGDINSFAPTAMFNMDAAQFLSKYLADLADGQRADGAFPDVAPTQPKAGVGNFGWGDVGVFLPWALYQNYGDLRLLEQHYDAAKRWVDFRTSRAKNDLNRDGSFGDWLSPRPQTSNEILSPMYHAQSALVLSQMAEALGKTEDAQVYRALAARIRRAFAVAFVNADGTLKDDTQTAYAIALRFDMLPPQARELAKQHLVRTIAQANNHLSTGFLGTGHLLPALSSAGQGETAFRLLMTDTFPSWLFSVRNGATTIWERWDGYSPVTGPNNAGDMNSYNHYAFGAVGEWMYADIAGFTPDPAAPGWRHVVIQPQMHLDVSWARGEYKSIRGTFVSAWKRTATGIELEVRVPVHAHAQVRVPSDHPAMVLESGKALQDAEGVQSVTLQSDAVLVEVGAGRYRFTSSKR